MDSLVSVIVPIYNTKKQLIRCLESIRLQTYKNLEIILINDGSTDGSYEQACDYIKKDERFLLLSQRNSGQANARNRGMKESKGDYLCFVDSDDYIEKEMIEVMVGAIESENADIALCGRFDEYPKKKKINFSCERRLIWKSEECIRHMLLWDMVDTSVCDKIYKRHVWSDCKFPEGRTAEDTSIIPYVINKANNIVHVGVPLYHYCHRNESITTSIDINKLKDYYRAIMEMKRFVNNYYPAINNEMQYFLNKCFLSLLIMASEINYTGDEVYKARETLRKHWFDHFCYSHIGKKEKIYYILLKLKIFKIVRSLKKVLYK